MRYIIRSLVWSILIIFCYLGFVNMSRAATETYIQVPTSFMSWSAWQRVEQLIENAPTEIVVLLWEGRGGRLDIGDSFGQFMRASSKYIIVEVIGPAESMHALGVCYAKKVILMPHSFLMFHLRSENGVYPDLSWGAKEENTKMMRNCESKGLVTESDISIVNSAKELYVYPDHTKFSRRDERLDN